MLAAEVVVYIRLRFDVSGCLAVIAPAAVAPIAIRIFRPAIASGRADFPRVRIDQAAAAAYVTDAVEHQRFGRLAVSPGSA